MSSQKGAVDPASRGCRTFPAIAGVSVCSLNVNSDGDSGHDVGRRCREGHCGCSCSELHLRAPPRCESMVQYNKSCPRASFRDAVPSPPDDSLHFLDAMAMRCTSVSQSPIG